MLSSVTVVLVITMGAPKPPRYRPLNGVVGVAAHDLRQRGPDSNRQSPRGSTGRPGSLPTPRFTPERMLPSGYLGRRREGLHGGCVPASWPTGGHGGFQGARTPRPYPLRPRQADEVLPVKRPDSNRTSPLVRAKVPDLPRLTGAMMWRTARRRAAKRRGCGLPVPCQPSGEPEGSLGITKAHRPPTERRTSALGSPLRPKGLCTPWPVGCPAPQRDRVLETRLRPHCRSRTCR